MGWDVASLYLPVEGAVREEMKQFTTRHVVLRIHKIEITMDGIYDDAVWHTDLIDFWRIRETGANNLVGSYVDDTIGYGIGHRYLAPLTAIEKERVAYDAEIADGLIQMSNHLHLAISPLVKPVDLRL